MCVCVCVCVCGLASHTKNIYGDSSQLFVSSSGMLELPIRLQQAPYIFFVRPTRLVCVCVCVCVCVVLILELQKQVRVLPLLFLVKVSLLQLTCGTRRAERRQPSQLL